jgi:hypothetical protein
MKTLELAVRLALVTTLASLTACGGGGSSTTSDPVAAAPAVVTPPPVAVPIGTAGVFDVNYGQFRGVYTFLDDNSFYGIHLVGGSTLAGHPHGTLSAANSVTARDPIGWANFIDDANEVGAQEPSGVFGRTFNPSSIDVSITGSMGTFKTTATTQKLQFAGSAKTLYNDPIALSVVAGSYQGIVRTAGINQKQQNVTGFTIDANGAYTVSVVDCIFTGTLVQHGATGIFDTQVKTSGANCKLNPALKGIVTPLSMPSNNLPQLAFQLNSVDNTHTAVFIVTKG